MGLTLEEALVLGRGVERPFRCIDPKHEDSNASASVNTVKMVWHCYACGASGKVDGNRAPTAEELLSMLEPEQAARELPASTAELYGWGGYWLDRFPDWLCWVHGLGEDPWTAEPVFPVHTPRGRLAGWGRRQLMPDVQPRYKFPWHWSASRTLYGSRGNWKLRDVVVLVEGAADTAAMHEVGVFAHGTYSAGLHAPQRELVLAMKPQLVLIGYDADEAGDKAAAQAHESLHADVEVGFLDWALLNVKDPAEAKPDDRLALMLDAVGQTSYGDTDAVQTDAAQRVATARRLFVEEYQT